VLKIKSVKFERLKTFGQFENVRIGAEADTEGVKPEQVLEELKVWVDRQIDDIVSKPYETEMEQRIERLTQRYQDLLNKLEEAKTTLLRGV
jgi:hypothetical protein